MKLNNKGFAITSVLYGLLILFVGLVGTYLTILSSKKDRLDIISEEINNKYGFNTCLYKDTNDNCIEKKETITFPYTPEYTGKYIFEGCSVYLKKEVTYESNPNSDCSNNLIQVYYNEDTKGDN